MLNVMVGGTSTNTGCAISWPVLCQVSTSTCLRQERHLSRNNFITYARYCRIALVGSECHSHELFKSGYASFRRPAYRQSFRCLPLLDASIKPTMGVPISLYAAASATSSRMLLNLLVGASDICM
jgi:hypothetical protein